MKERLVGRHLLGPIVGLIVALLVPAGISSTAAAGPVVPSDAGEITRTYGVDYWTAKSAELRLATARPAEIDRSTANTPAVGERAGLQLVVERFAPSSAPPIKPGAVDGPTSVKPFGQRVKDDVVAENLEVTGGDVPVCVWCRMDTPNPHIDHAVPKSHGGNATLSNGQVSCPLCNMSRGNGPNPVTPPAGYEGPWPPPWWPDS